MVSGAGVLVVAELVDCASEGAWPKASTAANIANPKRKPALIASRSCHETRRSARVRLPMAATAAVFKHKLDERSRTRA
jgi:hypothetical protein